VTLAQTESGLLIHARNFGPPNRAVPDPKTVPPRSEIAPNTNPPIGTVGVDVPTGVGDQHVMYPASNPPITPIPWAGWPVEWDMPAWDNAGVNAVGLLDVVFAAVDRNASAFASMPPSAIKNGRRLADQPTWTRNPQPEIYASFHEFANSLWWAFQIAGEAILLATSRYENGWPRTFMVAPPWMVTIDIHDGLRRYMVAGEDVSSDCLHIRYMTVGGDAHGHGPLEAAGNRIIGIKALQRYSTDLAKGGGVPWGVLKSKFRLSEAQATQMRVQWATAARDRLGAPAVLDSETDLQITQIQPRDFQLVEQSQASEARLSVLLGVPPYMLALPTNAGSMTYNNAALIYQEHYGWLRTKIAQISGALSGWALPWGTEVEFDAERYIQPPPNDRATYYKDMFGLVDETGARVMTVEDIRRAERLDLLEAPS
jgi:HK97 family phage portal protein